MQPMIEHTGFFPAVGSSRTRHANSTDGPNQRGSFRSLQRQAPERARLELLGESSSEDIPTAGVVIEDRRLFVPAATSGNTVGASTKNSFAPMVASEDHVINGSKRDGFVEDKENQPAVIAHKRGRTDEGEKEPFRNVRRRISEDHHRSESTEYPERQTPELAPDHVVDSEARARVIWQGLRNKASNTNKLHQQINDVEELLRIAKGRSLNAKEQLVGLRRRRKVLERAYMQVLKSDARLYDGTRSWREPQEGEPFVDRSNVRKISEEPHSSDFVESSDS
jgi:hypothetical protein